MLLLSFVISARFQQVSVLLVPSLYTILIDVDLFWFNLVIKTVENHDLIHQHRFHADEDCRELKSLLSPPRSLAQVAPRVNLFLTPGQQDSLCQISRFLPLRKHLALKSP